MYGWPVVVTNACADRCATEFGLAGREPAREWLTRLVGERGRITDQLPAPMRGRRSKSGYFCVIDGMLVLPLAADRLGNPQWIATNCLAFPDYRRRYGTTAAVDPFPLSGTALLAQVNFTEHAVQRFQQRCGGHPDPLLAREQLNAALGPGTRATRRPPAWCRTQPADFYLVAGDEYCLPMSRDGSGGKPFDAKTCIHRASDLFAARGPALASYCRLDPDTIPPGSEDAETVVAALRSAGLLSWHQPPWAKPEPRARFWILFTGRLAAPVAWHPDAPQPLTVLSLAHRRSLLARLLGWPRRHRRTP